jgi:hypothetical protein
MRRISHLGSHPADRALLREMQLIAIIKFGKV